MPSTGTFLGVPDAACADLLIDNFDVRLECLSTLCKAANLYFRDSEFSRQDAGHITQFMAQLVVDVILLRREVRDVRLMLAFDTKQRWFFEKYPEAVEWLVQYWVRSAAKRGDTSHSEADYRWLVTESLRQWPHNPVPKSPHPHLRLVT